MKFLLQAKRWGNVFFFFVCFVVFYSFFWGGINFIPFIQVWVLDTHYAVIGTELILLYAPSSHPKCFSIPQHADFLTLYTPATTSPAWSTFAVRKLNCSDPWNKLRQEHHQPIGCRPSQAGFSVSLSSRPTYACTDWIDWGWQPLVRGRIYAKLKVDLPRHLTFSGTDVVQPALGFWCRCFLPKRVEGKSPSLCPSDRLIARRQRSPPLRDSALLLSSLYLLYRISVVSLQSIAINHVVCVLSFHAP